MSDSSGDERGAETLSKMQQRHKKELSAHKKVTAKLGKKKKDEIAALDKGIADRHARELTELQAAAAGGGGGGADGGGAEPAAVEDVTDAMADAAIEEQDDGPAQGGKKPGKSKAQKRREAKERQEREREERIAEEKANMGPTERAIEEGQLREKLAPLGLGLREIKADGHCLYRAVEDQLCQKAGGPMNATYDFQMLRGKAAQYMREHPDDFLPFLMDLDGGDGDLTERFERYCDEVESTATWGGQLELRALAQSLGVRLQVYSAHLPMVVMGEEFGGEEDALKVAYQLHSFGLGEHYNSVEPTTGA